MKQHEIEARTANTAFCASVADGSPINFGSLLALVRAEVFQLGFCTFHFSSHLYSAFVLGDRNSNSTPAQSVIVSGKHLTPHRKEILLIENEDNNLYLQKL